MNSVFGGKLTGGIFAIIGAIIAIIAIIDHRSDHSSWPPPSGHW